jgi:hypothetical protein
MRMIYFRIQKDCTVIYLYLAPSAPLFVLVQWWLILQKDNFTCLFIITLSSELSCLNPLRAVCDSTSEKLRGLRRLLSPGMVCRAVRFKFTDVSEDYHHPI